MLRAGQAVQLIAIALLGLAVVMVQSAQISLDQTQAGLGSLLLSRTMVYAVLAVAIMFLASRIDVRQVARQHGWASPAFWALAVAIALVVAAMLPGVGAEINGARRWLFLGPRSWGQKFQPSELVKWALVLSLAVWCHHRAGEMRRFTRGLLPPLALLGLCCLLVVKEDLGTGALIGLVGMTVLLAAGARWWHLALMVPPAAAALLVAVASSPYRRDRLVSFLDPFADPLGKGYQAVQSLLAFAQGGGLGRGIGQSVQARGYLPTDTSDFIFPIICEELGFAGAALVVLLYVALLWVGLGVLSRQRTAFGRLFALGVIATVGLQAMINLAVVTTVVPTKGIALPLLSSGGTGWMVTAFAIGLLAGLDREDTVGTSPAAPPCTRPDAAAPPAA